jgi:16S rRNA (cytidine1402-2'-O)-methyltransferase
MSGPVRAGADERAGQARGRLAVVATPIGNLDDITLRALATLKSADLVLAEDTRRTRKLLAHHVIPARLRALHAHSSPEAIERCLVDLRAGYKLALVTDAGTPLLSDPGARLVAAANAERIEVVSIPGASAVTAALSVCGLPFDEFRFAGFPPRTGGKRKQWLEAIAARSEACVFFESPLRLGQTLADLAACLPPERPVAVCRELTKMHEEVVRGSAAELAGAFGEGTRGEITVVVAAGATVAPRPAADPATELEPRITALLQQGVSARDIARSLARELGLSRREIYGRVQAMIERG